MTHLPTSLPGPAALPGSARQRWTSAQRFALVFGVVYLAVAVAGFALTGVTDFSAGNHATLVVFAINPLHNVIHLVLGVAALIGAFRPRSARLVDLGLGAALGLVTVLGLLGWLGMMGMTGLADPDNFLHLASAVLALLVGSTSAPDGTADEATGEWSADAGWAS